MLYCPTSLLFSQRHNQPTRGVDSSGPNRFESPNSEVFVDVLLCGIIRMSSIAENQPASEPEEASDDSRSSSIACA